MKKKYAKLIKEAALVAARKENLPVGALYKNFKRKWKGLSKAEQDTIWNNKLL